MMGPMNDNDKQSASLEAEKPRSLVPEPSSHVEDSIREGKSLLGELKSDLLPVGQIHFDSAVPAKAVPCAMPALTQVPTRKPYNANAMSYHSGALFRADSLRTETAQFSRTDTTKTTSASSKPSQDRPLPFWRDESTASRTSKTSPSLRSSLVDPLHLSPQPRGIDMRHQVSHSEAGESQRLKETTKDAKCCLSKGVQGMGAALRAFRRVFQVTRRSTTRSSSDSPLDSATDTQTLSLRLRGGGLTSGDESAEDNSYPTFSARSA